MKKGKIIKTIERVDWLARNKKCVALGIGGRRMPAAFVINFQARILLRIIKSGTLREYVSNRKIINQ